MTSFGRGHQQGWLPLSAVGAERVIGVPELWNCASLLTLYNKQVIMTFENILPTYAAFNLSLIAFVIIDSIP